MNISPSAFRCLFPEFEAKHPVNKLTANYSDSAAVYKVINHYFTQLKRIDTRKQEINKTTVKEIRQDLQEATPIPTPLSVSFWGVNLP